VSARVNKWSATGVDGGQPECMRDSQSGTSVSHRWKGSSGEVAECQPQGKCRVAIVDIRAVGVTCFGPWESLAITQYVFEENVGWSPCNSMQLIAGDSSVPRGLEAAGRFCKAADEARANHQSRIAPCLRTQLHAVGK